MSYSRSFTFNVSGSLSYPASQNGGTVTYNDYVHVNLYVDTSPFDASAAHCRNQIDCLTASMVQATVEMCNTRKQTARMISRSILGGFFKMIRSEISQQMTMLAAKLPMLLKNLQTRAEQCVDKKGQMRNDFQRITVRYSEIFNKLDENLVVSLKQLDLPLYKLSDKISVFVFADLLDVGVSFSTLGNMELTQTDVQITVAAIKKTALSLIHNVQRNLEYSKTLNTTINYMLYDEPLSSNKTVFTPIVLIEGDNVVNAGQAYRNVLVSEQFPQKDQIKDYVFNLNEEVLNRHPDEFQKNSIEQFLKQRISKFALENNGSNNTKRIIDEMIKIWQSSQNALIS